MKRKKNAKIYQCAENSNFKTTVLSYGTFNIFFTLSYDIFQQVTGHENVKTRLGKSANARVRSSERTSAVPGSAVTLAAAGRGPAGTRSMHSGPDRRRRHSKTPYGWGIAEDDQETNVKFKSTFLSKHLVKRRCLSFVLDTLGEL